MAMATLMYMTTDHVPVLASELVALLDPQPGELAIDCTFGGGGHARVVADRIGPTGTLVCVDRDPSAAERYGELEPELVCRSRFVAGDFADVLEQLGAEGERPDLVYMDLGISSLQLDAAERGFSYSYDAPLDMRMDTRQELSAREVVNEWPRERLAATIRERPHASWSRRSAPPSRPRTGSGAGTPPSAPSRRSGLPSTASSTRSTAPCPPPGRRCATAAASRRSRSTRSRTGA
jgi:16S rRNA (cytosine1402-N4)-methyltransferase